MKLMTSLDGGLIEVQRLKRLGRISLIALQRMKWRAMLM